MLLNKYFQRPLFWDYFICLLILTISVYLNKEQILDLPGANDSISVTTDVTTISLTLSGFILTLLTVLITFKSGSHIKKIEPENSETIFNLFFASPYYFETVKHLKNCIKSLIFIAVVGFCIKLFLNQNLKSYSFFFNEIGLTIIILSVWRCLLILSKILDFQKEEYEKTNK